MKKIEYAKRIACINADCKNHADQETTLSKILTINDHESSLGKFDILFCKNCKLGYTNPYPTPETAYLLYENKDTSDFDLPSQNIIDSIKDWLSVSRLHKISKGKTINSVLDYSTGNGRYAISAKNAFPNAVIHAVDFQEAPPVLLSNQAHIKYIQKDIFDKNTDTYDFIILRHVLEHTFDPAALVTYLSSHLTPKGILYIEVPNLESGCARVFRKYWKPYYVPRHIFHFTKKSLSLAIAGSGLKFQIGENEAPLMGNTFSILTGFNQSSTWVKVIGILLHPIQLLIEGSYGSSTCINAICSKPEASKQ